jgi:hypothetical protein
VSLWSMEHCGQRREPVAGDGDRGLAHARKIGCSIVRLRPMSVLAAQRATMGEVLTSVQLGAPLGTTQIPTSSVLEAGRSLSRVCRGMVLQVLVAWIITLPSAALLAALLALLIRPLGSGSADMALCWGGRLHGNQLLSQQM